MAVCADAPVLHLGCCSAQQCTRDCTHEQSTECSSVPMRLSSAVHAQHADSSSWPSCYAARRLYSGGAVRSAKYLSRNPSAK
eukprot:6203931-Pleurochrysis_carterae.AAC.1